MKNKHVVSIQSPSKQQNTIYAALLVALMVVFMAPTAFAFTAPTSGSFMYDMYDIGVNNIMKGAVGFVAGVFAIIYGAYCLIRAQWLPAIPAVLGGAMLLKADTIVTSMGTIF